MLPAIVLAAQVSFLCPTADATASIYCEAVHVLLQASQRLVEQPRLLLVDHTVLVSAVDSRLAPTIAESLETSTEVIAALQARSRQEIAISAAMEFERPYRLISEADARAMIDKPWPKDDLVIRLSTVMFSANQQEAFLYAAFTCNSRCGEGHVIRLKLSPAGWRVVRAVVLWIS